MFDRWIENGLLGVLDDEGIGCIVFSPLAQGLLTNKYLNGIPADSRAGKPYGYLDGEDVTEEALSRIRRLNALAERRGQSLAQMAVAWVLRHPGVTSALIGASRASQIDEIVAVPQRAGFTAEELEQIDKTLA